MANANNAWRREWRRNNPEKIKAYKRKHYAKNKEKMRVKSKTYYDANHEHILELERIRRSKNSVALKLRKRLDYKNNPEIFRAQKEKFRKTNRVSIMLSGAKKSAKQQQLVFDLDKDWFAVRLSNGVCELSGMPFDMDGRRSPNSPSVDRIDPYGGYTQSNCRLILWSINRALSNYGEDYMFAVFDRILTKRKGLKALEGDQNEQGYQPKPQRAPPGKPKGGGR